MASAVGKSQVAGDPERTSSDVAARPEPHAALPHRTSRDSRRGDEGHMVSSVASISSAASPPYWMTTWDHDRNRSVDSILPAGAITLQDNETSEHSDRNNACWAKSVEIVDYTIVNGGATSIGAFVVWNVRVETLNVRCPFQIGPALVAPEEYDGETLLMRVISRRAQKSYMNIRKRYSEFDDFRSKLVKTFPNFEAAVPALPPKSLVSKFRPRFLDKRRIGLQYFLNCILLNPEFSGSPILKEFLFS